MAAWCNLAATFLSAVEASFAVTKSQGFVIAMPDVMQLVFEVATKSAERGQWELLQRIRATLRRFFHFYWEKLVMSNSLGIRR